MFQKERQNYKQNYQKKKRKTQVFIVQNNQNSITESSNVNAKNHAMYKK